MPGAATTFQEDWKDGKLDPSAEDFNQGNGAAPATDADGDGTGDAASAPSPQVLPGCSTSWQSSWLCPAVKLWTMVVYRPQHRAWNVLLQAAASPPADGAAAASEPPTPGGAGKVAPEVSWQPARLAGDLGLARWPSRRGHHPLSSPPHCCRAALLRPVA